MGKGQGYFTNYPFHVFLILLNEFCERFSYYGMRAVLVLFMWKGLGFSPSTATLVYHAFIILCYATPIVGAVIADGWLGKYKTIFYLSILYLLGNAMMTAGAIPYNGSFQSWLPMLALVIIATGTGGIKPCVSSFGGDQYTPDQGRQKDSFFSIFYLTINIGSLISTLLIPYIRGNTYCFDDNCYALCFGIPAILILFSIIVFVLGTKWYTINPPGESIISRMCGCIGKAISKKCGHKDEQDKKEHWLDYASPEYDEGFIEDVKDVLSVSWLFIPLPVFWALFDQQGSKWVLQAQQMNGDMGSIVILPDQISFLNPFLIVFLIPLLESLIYPCLNKIKILHRPLQKMVFGMILAGGAFLIAGFLQIAIDSTQPSEIPVGQSKVQFINAGFCDDFKVNFTNHNYSVKNLEASEYEYVESKTYEFYFVCNENQSLIKNFTLESTNAYQIFVTETNANMYKQSYIEHTDKGESIVRYFNARNVITSVTMQDVNNNLDPYTFKSINPNVVSDYSNLAYATYNIYFNDENHNESEYLSHTISTKNGPVYAILLTDFNTTTIMATQIEEIGPWPINIFFQAPQYFLITIAELFFSPIGLGFSYSQAAKTMKSILSSIWLLTVCFGNIIIIIVEIVSSSGSLGQVYELFLFAGLMFLMTIVFAIMSIFYKYKVPRDVIDEDNKSISSFSSINSKDNKAFSKDVAETTSKESAASSKDTKDSGRGVTPQHSTHEDQQLSKQANSRADSHL